MYVGSGAQGPDVVCAGAQGPALQRIPTLRAWLQMLPDSFLYGAERILCGSLDEVKALGGGMWKENLSLLWGLYFHTPFSLL